MKNIVLTLAVIASAFAVLQTSPVQATEQSQQQEQKLKVECSTGAYGQTTTCKAEGEQRQEQRQKVLAQSIVYREGAIYHKPVDTALDGTTMALALGLMGLSAGAYVAHKRLV